MVRKLPVVRPEIKTSPFGWQVVRGPPCPLPWCVGFDAAVFVLGEFYHDRSVGDDAIVLKDSAMKHSACHAVGDVALGSDH